VVIDVVGYRRWGHNEGDEPAYTQPVMYERIKQTPTARQRYADQLAREGVVDAAQATTQAEQVYQRLTEVQQSLKAHLRNAGSGARFRTRSAARSASDTSGCTTGGTAAAMHRSRIFPGRGRRSSCTTARSPSSRVWASSTATPPRRPRPWSCGRPNSATSPTAGK